MPASFSTVSFFVVNFAAMMSMPLACIIVPTLWWVMTYFAIRLWWVVNRRKVAATRTVPHCRNTPAKLAALKRDFPQFQQHGNGVDGGEEKNGDVGESGGMDFMVENPLAEKRRKAKEGFKKKASSIRKISKNFLASFRKRLARAATRGDEGDDEGNLSESQQTQLRAHGVSLTRLLKQKELDVPVLKDRLQRNCIVSVLALTWLIYMSVAQALFDVFDCREVKYVPTVTKNICVHRSCRSVCVLCVLRVPWYNDGMSLRGQL